MITSELLELHDQLEAKSTARPWATVIVKRPGYGSLVFWSRRPNMEVLFNHVDDARYLTFIRNISPELVKEIRMLKNKVAELEDKVAELLKGEKNDS